MKKSVDFYFIHSNTSLRHESEIYSGDCGSENYSLYEHAPCRDTDDRDGAIFCDIYATGKVFIEGQESLLM